MHMTRSPYIVLLMAALALTLAGCSRLDEAKTQVFTREDVAMEVMKGVEIVYSDSARVQVRIHAPLLRNITDPDMPRQEFPEGVQVDFLKQNGEVGSWLIARFGLRMLETGTVIARDSVVLQTEKQEVLETEELIWDEQSGKIRTDKFVKMTKIDEVIYGFGLEAEQDFSYWRILAPKGSIKAGQLNEAIY
jgi:hypothetical protein